jgi:polyisoprenyl-phosphate glycosyltransferase
MDISVVIPVYGCRVCLEELHRQLSVALSALVADYEIVLVNDACPQNSWEVIKAIATGDPHVKGLDLSRNFGQIRAITAGLHHASGDWIVVMDCDLQDKPAEIARLYAKAIQGYDVVFSRRAARKDGFFKKLLSRLFYRTYTYFTAGAFDSLVSNFSISRRVVIENYLRMGDQNRAFVLFINWMGFRSTVIDIEHAERASGHSSYSMAKRMKLALEIITTQSNKPLILSIRAGFTVSLLALIYAVYLVARYLYAGVSVEGWTSTIVSIYFVAGILLAQLGIVGLYVGYVFDQTKGRPIFIVREIYQQSQRTTSTAEVAEPFGAEVQR